jgi:hypothetical protein
MQGARSHILKALGNGSTASPGNGKNRDGIVPDGGAQGPDGTIPAGKWWPGIGIYAITNVGFLKLFEVCSTMTDMTKTLTLMACYYAIAFALRYILRSIIGLRKPFPQFFWEGIPKRSYR